MVSDRGSAALLMLSGSIRDCRFYRQGLFEVFDAVILEGREWREQQLPHEIIGDFEDGLPRGYVWLLMLYICIGQLPRGPICLLKLYVSIMDFVILLQKLALQK